MTTLAEIVIIYLQFPENCMPKIIGVPYQTRRMSCGFLQKSSLLLVFLGIFFNDSYESGECSLWNLYTIWSLT